MAQLLSINRAVIPRVLQLIQHASLYNIYSYTLENGTQIVDVGLAAPGSLEAARINAEIMLGGLGTVTYGTKQLGGMRLLTAEVIADQVLVSCVASQIAGWKIPCSDSEVIGSGPARTLAEDPHDHSLAFTPYRDVSEIAVLALQTETAPTVELARYCAEACGVACENLYLLVHSTTSIAASVQVSARIIEQTMNKMMLKGFPLDSISQAYGSCIIAPVSPDWLTAMGRINDALLYGGICTVHAACEDTDIESRISRLVTASSKDYGKLFKDAFIKAGKEFYRMDVDIHSPARVEVYNSNSGRVFASGEFREDLLCKSFFA